jgi:SOS response regulatory protein OraA/RecX
LRIADIKKVFFFPNPPSELRMKGISDLSMPIRKTKPPESAQAAAFRLLGMRDYSCEELRRKLAGKGFPSEEAERVVGDFEKRGLLDDSKLAQRLAHLYSDEKLWGPQKVLAKLSRRGIPLQLAKVWVEQESPVGTTQERLRKALDLRVRRTDPQALSPQEKRRVANYLRQKGFGWEDIWEALRETGGSTEE